MKKNLALFFGTHVYMLLMPQSRTIPEKFFSRNIKAVKKLVFVDTADDLIKEKGSRTLLEILFMSEMFQSKGDVRRIIQQGGVRINKEQVFDPFHSIDKPNPFIVIQAGKRKFIKVVP